jgi:esterase/lipase
MHKILLTRDKREIAYKHYKGKSKIGFLFFPGFNSDMMGTKAIKIYNWCKKNKFQCTLFDYSGHGKSSEKFIDSSIKEWIEDSNEILHNVTSGPQILIGSSMGGWLALKVGLMNNNKIKGIITIAAAPDFTKRLWENDLKHNQREAIIKNGFTIIASKYDEKGYIITKKNIDAGNKNLILGSKILEMEYPLRLIHGDKDESVSWQESLKIFNKCKSLDAELIIIKNGDHRLSSKSQLKKIIITAQSLFDEVNK